MKMNSNGTLIAILLLTVVLLAGCSSKENKNSTDDALLIYQESMKVHDEIMPRMDEMFKLENALKARQDSLAVDTVANATQLIEIRSGIASLKSAGKNMMDWMHHIQDVPGAEKNNHSGHNKPSTTETLTDEELLKIQQDQKAAIDQVKIDMETSIAQAKKLLNRS
jgi:hypothetical protein